jgi:glycosyltransferase involved in cell wall biosynthesis
MISVIIPSFNSETTIKKCLQSILEQTFEGGFEIILVDSSVDKTPIIVKEQFPHITYIHLDKKTDPGTARNIGIGKSKGDLIAFIDSDCVADCNWLANIASAHKGSYRIVGGVVCNGNEKFSDVAWAGYLAEFREFLPEMPSREVEHIPTCNLSYKKSIFNDYGLFQGKYYPQEDLVFNYTLRKKSEKILCEPSIRIFHNHRTRLKDFLDHQKRIGTITSRVLKTLDLEGAFIARHRAVALLSIPFLPAVKFFKTMFVFLCYQPKTIIKRPIGVIFFALGLLYWIIGFVKGVFDEPI